GVGRPHGRLTCRRTHRRGAADLQLGGAALGGRAAHSPTPEPVGSTGRGTPCSGGQTAARAQLTAPPRGGPTGPPPSHPRCPDRPRAGTAPRSNEEPCRHPFPCLTWVRASPREPSPSG